MTVPTTYAELFEAWSADTLGLIRVAYPAQVQSYDPATLLASVKLACPILFQEKDGSIRAVSVPPITCPVCFPGLMTWPINEGDEGLVVFADRETNGWRQSGAVDAPPTEGRFRLEDAHLLPVLTGRPVPPAVPQAAAVPGTVIRGETYLGGPAAQLLSSDPLVQAQLARLWAAVVQVNAAIPTGTAAVLTDPLQGPTATTKTRGE